MAVIYMDFDHGVPQLAYTGCTRCSSTMGISLCQTRNRGCCSYFPKFYPVELQRMACSSGGGAILDTILKHPGMVLMEDHVVVKGTFDSVLHDRMQRSHQIPDDGFIQDNTVFFRTCPFVRSGLGCTLPARYRAYVCNFFVCREVLENPAYKQQIAPYLRERANYVRFLEWENNQLLQIIHDNGLSIRSNIKAVIELLAALPVNQYEFPALEPVEIPEGQDMGA